MKQAMYRPTHYVLPNDGEAPGGDSFVRSVGHPDLRVALCGRSSAQAEILCTEHLDQADCPRCIQVVRNLEDCHLRMGTL